MDRFTATTPVIEKSPKKSQHSCWPSDGDIHSLIGGTCSRKASRQKSTIQRGSHFPPTCGESRRQGLSPVEK